MIRNGLRRSEAVSVGLIADDRKHRRKMFPYKTEVIEDKRTTYPLRSEEKKAHSLRKRRYLNGRVSRKTIVCRR